MSENSNIYYVYFHRKLSDNSIFYIGKGSNDRYKNTSGRNADWWSIVLAEKGFNPSIYACELTEQEALEKESQLIKDLASESLTNVKLNTKDSIENTLNIGDIKYEENCQIKLPTKPTLVDEKGVAKLRLGFVPNFAELCKEYVQLKKKPNIKLTKLEKSDISFLETECPVIKNAYEKFGEEIFTRTRYSKKKIETELLKLKAIKDPNVIRKLLNLEIGKKYALEELKNKILSLPIDYQPTKKTANSIQDFYKVKKTQFSKNGKVINGYVILGVK